MSEVTTEFVRQSKTMRLVKLLTAIPPVWIDGGIGFGIAVLTAMASGLSQIILNFSSDETAKFITPTNMFWIKFGIAIFALFTGAITAGLISIRDYRSKNFAEHMAKKLQPPTP